MGVAESVAQPVVRSVASTAAAGGGSDPWSPLEEPNLIQWALDKGETYQASKSSGVWYLQALENTRGGKTAYPMRLDPKCLTLNGASYASGTLSAAQDKIALTLQATFRVTTATTQSHLISIGDASREIRLKLNSDGGNSAQGFLTYDSTVNLNPGAGTAAVATDTWYTMTFAVESGNQKLWLNGTEVSSGTTTFTDGLTGATNIRIGQWHQAGSTTLTGNIADARIYDGFRTDAEIAASPATDVIAWFSCQDGGGLALRGTGGVSLTLAGDTAANIWANTNPGIVKDWAVVYGGSVAVDHFIPAEVDGSGLDVQGSSVQSTGGKYHPDFTTLVRDPLSNAALDDLDGTTDTEQYREDLLGFRDRLISAVPSFS